MNRLIHISATLLLIFTSQLKGAYSGFSGIDNYGHGNGNTAKALANLSQIKNQSGRSDLARYLSYDLIDKEHAPVPTNGAPLEQKGTNISQPGSTISNAISPLAKLCRFSAPENPGLEKQVTQLGEGLLRTGFGVPLRILSMTDTSRKPLKAKLNDLARALRAAKGKALLRKAHVSLENIIKICQEYHYLLSVIDKDFAEALSNLDKIESAFTTNELASSGGLLLLQLKQLAILSRNNLTFVRESLKRDKLITGKNFSILKNSLSVLDEATGKVWSIPDNKLTMSDVPGTLKTLYSHVAGAVKRTEEQKTLSENARELTRLNYRNCTACILSACTTVLNKNTMRKLNYRESEAIFKVTSISSDLLKKSLSALEKEHRKTTAKLSRKKEEGVVARLPFPPQSILLSKSSQENRLDPSQDSETEYLVSTNIWDPAISDIPETDAAIDNVIETNQNVTPATSTSSSSEDVIETHRDMDILDSLESSFSMGESIMADGITASFINARHRKSHHAPL